HRRRNGDGNRPSERTPSQGACLVYSPRRCWAAELRAPRSPGPPVRVLSRLFRRLVLEKLAAAHKAGALQFFGKHAPLTNAQAFAAYLAPLRNREWVVYSKPPFGGPAEVLRYLARTHRVAISNRRLVALNDS